MSESIGPMRAVDRMVDAIRADEPPELDWEKIERSLLVRVRRGEGARPAARPVSGAWQVLAFAAAAAIVPVAMSLGAHGASLPAVAEQARVVDVATVAAAAGEAGTRGEHDLTALRTGDAVEATRDAITFADAGHVRWTLSPESRLVVRSPMKDDSANERPGSTPRVAALAAGIGHVVRLERGSLRVEVQPDLVKHGLVDVLAVEVGHTRIAVHGTAFTVSLRDSEVVVEVEHGVVTVGPTGQRGATTGYQLPAGSRAAFSLDGGKKARWLAPASKRAPEPVAANHAVDAAPALTVAPAVAAPSDDVPSMTDPPPSAHGAKPTAVAANAKDAKDGDAEPTAPTAVEPARALMDVGSIQAGLRRCFAQAHPAAGVDGPKLTASSTFTLKIRADGSIAGAQFNPPLPSIQGCAAFVWAGKFAPSAADRTVAIPVSLTQ